MHVFFSSRRRHTRLTCDWSSDVCSSDLVADSPDSSKRQRGRRGLDMLNRLQNNSSLDIEIVETDFPSVREVDLKLIELGKQLDAVIVTNDFNLNKVAQLRGVTVLNFNELANALQQVVLQGESMR